MYPYTAPLTQRQLIPAEVVEAQDQEPASHLQAVLARGIQGHHTPAPIRPASDIAQSRHNQSHPSQTMRCGDHVCGMLSPDRGCRG